MAILYDNSPLLYKRPPAKCSLSEHLRRRLMSDTPSPTSVLVGTTAVETHGALRFRERIAVVTGAASGIGRAVAERFLAEGAVVYALDRSEDQLRTIWHGVARAVPVAVDVSDSAQVTAAFAQVEAEHGRLD